MSDAGLHVDEGHLENNFRYFDSNLCSEMEVI